MSGGILEERSECCCKFCWRAGDVARPVNFRDLDSGFQFALLLIENQHLVRVREANLEE